MEPAWSLRVPSICWTPCPWVNFFVVGYHSAQLWGVVKRESGDIRFGDFDRDNEILWQ